MKHINTVCWQNATFFGVKVGGTYIYSRGLNSKYPWTIILTSGFELF
jgi:hypothetical protein